mmetsp:Transcript_5145/g.19936  ORF Transcript_5145/g.19936 Transcript_5145/m.19936 type:complete len:211 (+) Transcript_5145:1679-2311(+)
MRRRLLGRFRARLNQRLRNAIVSHLQIFHRTRLLTCEIPSIDDDDESQVKPLQLFKQIIRLLLRPRIVQVFQHSFVLIARVLQHLNLFVIFRERVIPAHVSAVRPHERRLRATDGFLHPVLQLQLIRSRAVPKRLPLPRHRARGDFAFILHSVQRQRARDDGGARVVAFVVALASARDLPHLSVDTFRRFERRFRLGARFRGARAAARDA